MDDLGLFCLFDHRLRTYLCRGASVEYITDYFFQGLLEHVVNAEKIEGISVVEAVVLAYHKVRSEMPPCITWLIWR
jgi:hypothetical protein